MPSESGGRVYCGGSVIPRESRARAPYVEYGRHVCLRNAMVVVTVEMIEEEKGVVLGKQNV